MIDNRLISAYTPSNTDPETRERIFVQRHTLLRRVVRWCEESMLTGDKHHLLFIGPRGCGKTHLVAMAHDRLRRNPKLGDKMRVAWLGEDDVFTGLIDFALRIADELAKEYPDEFSADYRAKARALPADDAAELILHEIVGRLGDKSILLIMENLNRAFRGLGDLGQKKWRAFLQENGRVATLATSQQLFEDVSSRDAAFYGFFEIVHLEPLSVDDAGELMAKIAAENDKRDLVQFLGTPEGRYRVRALHHLAGGNHRMYVMLSEFLTRDSLDALVAAFEGLAEDLTPYFQERVGALSPQQARIVQSLCNASGAMTVKEVAEDTFISDRNVSKQLGELKQKRYVISERRGKESFYEMAEPLMRLCLEVKKQRGKPLRLVAAFLRAWYSPKSLQDELEGKSGIAAGNARSLAYREAALREDDAFQQAVARKLRQQFDSNLACRQFDHAMNVAEELVYADRPAGLIRRSQVLREKGHPAQALQEVDEALSLRGLGADERAEALRNRGITYGELGESEKAIADFSAVIEMEEVPADQKVRALFSRGYSYGELGESEKAIADYSAVVEMEEALTDQKAMALVNRGNAYVALGESEKAIADCSAVIAMEEALTDQKAMALANRGNAYVALGESEKAIADCSAVIAMEEALTDQKAIALVNRGNAYVALGESEKAIADCSGVIEMEEAPADLKAVALYNRGNRYGKLGESEKAIDDYSAVIEMEEAPTDQKAMALFNRGITYGRLDESHKAIADYSAVIEMEEAPADEKAMALLNRGASYWHSRQFEASLNDYTAVAEMSGVSSSIRTGSLFWIPEAMIPIKSLDESVASLERAFCEGDPEASDYGGTPRDVLRMVLDQGHPSWAEFAERLIPIYAKYGALDSLGTGLTQTIEVLDGGEYSELQLDLWNSSWQRFGADLEELSIALASLSAAVQVIKTGSDRPLFDLPLEIRELVRGLLKNTLSEK